MAAFGLTEADQILASQFGEIQRWDYFIPVAIANFVTSAVAADDERVPIRRTTADISCMARSRAVVFIVDLGHVSAFHGPGPNMD